jgi:TetR/AcrR family transcriptional regulator, lmrAB and yxaGH operons repressor
VAGQDDPLLDHAGSIFGTWTDFLADLYATGGLEPGPARQLAITLIAAAEGAVAICRAERSREPFDDVSSALRFLCSSFAVS